MDFKWILKGTDIPIQKQHLYMYLTGVRLRPYVECIAIRARTAKNDIETLRISSS